MGKEKERPMEARALASLIQNIGAFEFGFRSKLMFAGHIFVNITSQAAMAISMVFARKELVAHTIKARLG